VTLIT